MFLGHAFGPFEPSLLGNLSLILFFSLLPSSCLGLLVAFFGPASLLPSRSIPLSGVPPELRRRILYSDMYSSNMKGWMGGWGK